MYHFASAGAAAGLPTLTAFLSCRPGLPKLRNQFQFLPLVMWLKSPEPFEPLQQTRYTSRPSISRDLLRGEGYS